VTLACNSMGRVQFQLHRYATQALDVVLAARSARYLPEKVVPEPPRNALLAQRIRSRSID
jgi:hypothetical protein